MKEEKDNFLKDFYRRIAQSSEEISKSEEVNEIFRTHLKITFHARVFKITS